MEKIERYKANDGTIFDTEIKCVEYEQLCNQVHFLMYKLNPLPKDDHCKFGNGGGYIQQDSDIVEKAKKQLTELGNSFFKQKEKWGFPMIGRLFDDSGNRCLYHAWERLSNIDHLYREWGQFYYAAYPTEGVQIEYVESV